LLIYILGCSVFDLVQGGQISGSSITLQRRWSKLVYIY